MAKEKILVVDDEEDIVELVRYNLSREGYQTLSAETGEKALRLARTEKPDLVVLDLMLPGMDGLEVTRAMKGDAELRRIPIVMLTAKGEEPDIVAGLEMGADDYIVKPFSTKILVARVRAALRRRRVEPVDENRKIEIDGIVINPGKRVVTVEDNPADLTFTEFQILQQLARRPGWVFTRSQIVEAVRGDDYPVTDRAVDVQIVGLRKKLGPCGNLIETVRGVGYRFRETP
ncbi:MAG: response regulator transcription factor [Desulfobacterales bacterium]|jgi:two-component system phosphate regulon response regulator PhoB|nr:response regulator transcription factor [Desulfobacterales bacterium]MDY0377106.1 response regulator transcription factor [Desulfobacterales bacterium]